MCTTKTSVWVLALFCLPIFARPTDLQASTNGFTFLPELTSPRQEHSVTAVGNKVYVVGGITSNYSYTPSTLSAPSAPKLIDLVQSYNIDTRVWSNAANLPVSINHGNIASIGGKIYLLGGLLGLNLTRLGATSNSWVYDPKTNAWTSITPMPATSARGACAIGIRKSEVYLAGGMRAIEFGSPGLQDSVALVSSYNTKTGVWNTNYPPLPEARDHVGGAIVGSKFYVTGGRDRGQRNVRGNTWVLDLNNPSAGWKTLAPMPTPRGGLATAAIGRCIYTFGGEGNPNTTSGVFNNVEVYDTRTNKWEELAPLWAGFHGTNAVARGGTIYIPGGGYKFGTGTSNFSVAYKPQSRCGSWSGW